MMIHVVQANPAMDRIEVLTHVELDAVNRSVEVHVLPGGKGMNVARAVRQLGGRVAAYGFAGGFVGDFIRGRCGPLGIEDRHTPIAGDSRICMILVERDSGRSTVVNEPGPTVSADEADALVTSVVSHCQPGDLVVMTGSLPPGLSDDYYARIVTAVQDVGARAIVDTSGFPLREAMAHAPWMVKSNVGELREALGDDLAENDEAALFSAMRAQQQRGSEVVVITMGARGLLAVTADAGWRVTAMAIEPVNATGSGDLFLAGFMTALTNGGAMKDALRFGSACGIANALSVTPELPVSVDLDALAARIVVDQV